MLVQVVRRITPGHLRALISTAIRHLREVPAGVVVGPVGQREPADQPAALLRKVTHKFSVVAQEEMGQIIRARVRQLVSSPEVPDSPHPLPVLLRRVSVAVVVEVSRRTQATLVPASETLMVEMVALVVEAWALINEFETLPLHGSITLASPMAHKH